MRRTSFATARFPDLDDGLKPVQRRILHSLRENDDGKFIKVANIVGHTMQYHPHGDASIADALVSLTNKQYSDRGAGQLRQPVHRGSGGRVAVHRMPPDRAGAQRAVQPELTRFRAELRRPPQGAGHRLPSKLPLLLMMGAEGIAVGLSTRVLARTTSASCCRAQIAILEKKPFEVLPDFRAGRKLMDAGSNTTRGTGRVRLRAGSSRAAPNRRRQLIIRSVPYGTTTDSVIASIEAAAREKETGSIKLDRRLHRGERSRSASSSSPVRTRTKAVQCALRLHAVRRWRFRARGSS